MNTLLEHNIEASEVKFRNLMLQAPMIIATLLGPSFIVETVNERALEIWGKTYEEVINQPLFEVSPELASGLKGILENIYNTGVPFIANEREVQLKRASKTDTVYINSSYQPLRDSDNKIYGILLMAEEITDTINTRKSNKARDIFNHSILESSHDCLKVLDKDGRIEFMNFNGLCQMEIDDFSTVKNTYWWTLWGTENEALVKASIYKALKGVTANFTAFCPTVKGTPKWWDVMVLPIGKLGEPIMQIISVSRDITEQKKAEEKIKKSEERLQGGLDVANIVLAEFDYNTGLVMLSVEAALMYGLSSDNLIVTREQIHNTFHPDCKEKLELLIEKCLNPDGDGIIATDHRVLLPDGRTRWLKVNKQVYFDEHRTKPVYSILAAQDITERKNSEEKLKERSDQLQLTVENIPQSIFLFNKNGKLIYANEAAAKLYEFESVEALLNMQDFKDIRKKIVRTLKVLDENGEILPLEKLPSYISLTTGKPAEQIICLINKKIGTTQWVLAKSASLLDADGALYMVLVSVTDITSHKTSEEKLRQSELRFRTLAETLPQMIWVVNKQGIIEYASKSWEEYSGIADTAEAWNAMIHPEEKESVMANWGKAFAQENSFRHEMRLKNAAGEYRWHHSSGEVLKDENGNAIKWIGTITDIEEQKKFTQELEMKVNERTEELFLKSEQLEELNQTLELKNIQLENSNTELASFSYVASHDLQEPLRKIQTFSKRIIETEKFSDKAQDYFNRIIGASERMQDLIVALLDFSRANTAEIIFAPCDLNKIVEESKSYLNLSILEKQATIEYKNLPTINGVRIQLSQLFTNLIDNAIKYSKEEVTPHIEITASLIDGSKISHIAVNKKKQYYAIKIADNGIGFEKEYATKIFELFKRLHGKSEYSGTGIGLAIVKKIAANHNGFIIAEGKPDIGSTFTLYLPTV